MQTYSNSEFRKAEINLPKTYEGIYCL